MRRALDTALALVPMLAACGGLPPAPERPRPIAWADTLPIAEPAEREVVELTLITRAALSGEVSNVLGPRAWLGGEREALNVDRFDDVVDSAWYERRNRAGAAMTSEEVRLGPSTTGGPADGPLTIVAAKIQGISPGFTVEDARGDRYVLKFDPKGYLYLSSAAGVISNRLLHAAGYHVPEDYIFLFTLGRLRVEPGATYEDAMFVEHPLTLDVAHEALTRTDTLPDGRYVAVASKFVPGPPKGPFFFEGRRGDDPNDWYPHEHRRDLRGLRVVSAWINHVDMRFMNTLDAYVPPGYLRHYLIDFAATLGSGTIRPHEPREGLEYNFDLWDTVGRLFTLGFHRAGWEGVEWEPIHPTIGWLPGEAFDPEEWKANWPNEAFNHVTARDAYWGAKLVGAFSDEQIRAAVAAGGLPDRWAADTLATILETRRDAIVRHSYGRVSPVEDVEVEVLPEGGHRLTFTDYGIRDGAWTVAESRAWSSLQWPGRAERSPVSLRWIDGARATIDLPPPPAGRSWPAGEYGVLEVRIVREGSEVEPRAARIYLRWTEDGYEVAGLEH